jgi:integrase
MLADERFSARAEEAAEDERDDYYVVELAGDRNEVRHQVEGEREVARERNDQRLLPARHARVAEQSAAEDDAVRDEPSKGTGALASSRDDESEDERRVRERLVRVDKKDYRHPKPTSFQTYAETWFSEGPTRRRWKPRTIVQYRAVRRRLVDWFGPMPLQAIRPRHVAAYVAASRHGPATIGVDLSLLHAIFVTAQREEIVESNPAANAERPKLPPFRPQIVEPVEVARVAKAFTDEQARTVFLTLVLTGLRRSELQRLRWRDVDLVENVLRVRDSKTKDGIRSIALTRTLTEELTAHLGRSAFQGADELVFCHPERGTIYRPETFKEALTAALAAAGVEKQPRAFHDLRHTAITNDAAAGSSPIAVMTKAGHADMATTKHYLHLAGVVFRDEADALERRLGLSTEPSARPSAPQRTLDDSVGVAAPLRASAE